MWGAGCGGHGVGSGWWWWSELARSGLVGKVEVGLEGGSQTPRNIRYARFSTRQTYRSVPKLHVSPDAQPRFYRPRAIPYALRSRVDQALEKLVADGVLEPVRFSEWAAPIVPIVKRDGSIRVCGDYKLTVNQAALVDTYPLPLVQDIFASLANGKTFTKLDLAHAYQQLILDADSRPYTTINTHKGLFQHTRLPFGVAAAPAIFQRTMESLLGDLPHVCIYLDDILVTGESESAHLRNLAAVLERLAASGVRLKREKCSFMIHEVEYLGHCISAKGIHPVPEKVSAVREAPPPQDVSQLRSFLGMVNYYGKFLPNLATLLRPLYDLLQSTKTWSWECPQKQAFDKAKELLSSAPLLTHYDPSKPLILACDSSPYGVGAVLSHQFEDNTERPIAYASRTLSPAELKYAQLDKEALSIVFGVKHFHQYLFGRKFVILSDHKPLQYLLGETRGIPPMASARIQRWAIMLSAYQYEIRYKPGANHANADGLSRLPIPNHITEIPIPGDVLLLFRTLESTPIRATQIRQWTDTDPVLSRVRRNILGGWVEANDPELQPYQSRASELSVQDGCVLWGSRVVVPTKGREGVISILHEQHPGITRIKRLARGHVWWPGIDKELELAVRSCVECQEHQKSPANVPMHPWEWPDRPWARLHIDYAGPIKGKMVLVVSHSKWMEALVVNSATSNATVEKLQTVFATHGLPEVIVSDNGTAFTSDEFALFVQRNGIRHLISAPYHPASNGLAESYFTNEHLLKQVEKTVDIFERIHPDATALFLFDNAPSHRKVAEDALNADKMNIGPGGKQPIMRDTVWGGAVQKLVDEDGVAKGMRTILQERGVDTTGMTAKDMRNVLKIFPDFKGQKTILEDYIERRGHRCVFYPKFHCELSPIERVWCQSKRHTRAYADGTITKLRKIVPEGLDSVTVEQIKKYFRTCTDYEKAVLEGR